MPNFATSFNALEALSNYAPSNAASNWDFASNVSVWASNAISACPCEYSSNTASYASNALEALSNYAPSIASSNWDFASNVSVWASIAVGAERRCP